MICHAGAASAPAAPSRNEVASSAGVEAQPRATVPAKTAPTATTPTCAAIRRRRGSTTSASAPAGRVNRNIGAIVATWTAETISGSGLRLVISQLIAVSNIAMPMLEIELATRMTVKARLPNTPQREAAGVAAFDGRRRGTQGETEMGSSAHPCAHRAPMAMAGDSPTTQALKSLIY